MQWIMFIRKVKRQRVLGAQTEERIELPEKKDQDKCIKEARAIYNAKNRQEAVGAYNKWTKKWISVCPKAVKCMEKDMEELLNFYSCPQGNTD